MKLIIGLGNPGKDYNGTRHNVGFEVVDRLAQAQAASWSVDKKRQAEVARAMLADTPVILAKPTTYMNESGSAVQALVSYYKVEMADVLIIQDEMDLPVGRLAFLAHGGPAGHNGIIDIQEKLGGDDVARLRIGVGRPPNGQAKETWVLGKPSKDEREMIDETIENAAEAAGDWASKGLTKAMNNWN